MNGGRVRYFPEATRELEDAFEWYAERSLQAAEAFLHEIDRALVVILAAPEVWPSFEAGTRRYLLQRFPYSVVYRMIETGIVVVAFPHHKRRPGYWHGRLDE